MKQEEFKRMHNIVVNSAKNGWRAIIYKYFEEASKDDVVEFNPTKVMGYSAFEYNYYPKKMFRNEEFKICLMYDIENEYLSSYDEAVVIPITEMTIAELLGFCSFLLDNLKE
jgi:hypothetical protein